MSTTTELLAANQRYDKLRAAISALADEWEATYARYQNVAGDQPRILIYAGHARSLRALLDDQETDR